MNTKSILLSLFAVLTSFSMQAQLQMNVYTNGGSKTVFNIEKADSTLFRDMQNLGTAETQELLTNGDFERWTDNLPDDWKSTTSAGNAKLSQSTDAHSGQYAVVIEKASSNMRMASKELTLDAGTYTFSFYAKATESDDAKVKPGYTPVTDGKAGSYKYSSDYTALTTIDWTPVSYQFTLAQPTTVNLVMMNPSASAQNILIDDASLKLSTTGQAQARMSVYSKGYHTNVNIADIDSIQFNYGEPFILGEPTRRLEFPMPRENGNNLLIVHTATLNDHTGEQGINYSVEWDADLHAQRWSCYQLYAGVLQKNVDRYRGYGTGLDVRSQYPNDPDLPAAYQYTADPYPGTGYDHGHICPSDDRVCSAEANYQTFYITNMMPQTHALNAGMWSRMESQVKSWGAQFDTLYVCKGGTIDKQEHIMGYIGKAENSTPIPKYFFMALLGKNASGYTAIGLWVDHGATYTTKDPISELAINIRTLESLTGINFFHNLPDAIENTVETEDIEKLKASWGLSVTR